MLSDAQIQPLVRLLSLAGALILLSQILEIWAIMGSGLTGNAAERSLLILAAVAERIPLIVLADIVVFAGIIYDGNRVAFRLMGWAHLAMTLVFGLSLLVLAGDVMILRRGKQGRLAMTTGIRVGVTFGLAALLSVLTAWFSLRNSRKHKWVGRKRSRTPLLTDTEERRAPDPE